MSFPPSNKVKLQTKGTPSLYMYSVLWLLPSKQMSKYWKSLMILWIPPIAKQQICTREELQIEACFLFSRKHALLLKKLVYHFFITDKSFAKTLCYCLSHKWFSLTSLLLCMYLFIHCTTGSRQKKKNLTEIYLSWLAWVLTIRTEKMKIGFDFLQMEHCCWNISFSML